MPEQTLADLLAGFDLVCLDLDGVLVDSNELKLDCMRAALSGFDPQLVAGFVEEFRAAFGHSRREHFHRFHAHHLGRPSSEFEAFLDRHAGVYADLLAARYTHVPLCAHAGDLVRVLAARRIPLGVVTGTPAHEAERVLRHHGLRALLTAVVGGELPKPEGLHRLVELTGASPSRTVLVGDAAADLCAARSVGAAFVFVQRHALVDAGEVLAFAQGPVHLVHHLDPGARPVSLEHAPVPEAVR
jgi:phosphoglycolate phosphatase